MKHVTFAMQALPTAAAAIHTRQPMAKEEGGGAAESSFEGQSPGRLTFSILDDETIRKTRCYSRGQMGKWEREAVPVCCGGGRVDLTFRVEETAEKQRRRRWQMTDDGGV